MSFSLDKLSKSPGPILRPESTAPVDQAVMEVNKPSLYKTDPFNKDGFFYGKSDANTNGWLDQPPKKELLASSSSGNVKVVEASTSSPKCWQLPWTHLFPDEMRAAEILGWYQERWDKGVHPPSSSKLWSQLTQQEQDAATRLGWALVSWDSPDRNRSQVSQDLPSVPARASSPVMRASSPVVGILRGRPSPDMRVGPVRGRSSTDMRALSPTVSVSPSPSVPQSPSFLDRQRASLYGQTVQAAQLQPSVSAVPTVQVVQKPVFSSLAAPASPMQVSRQLVAYPQTQSLVQSPVVERPTGLTAQALAEVQGLLQRERSRSLGVLQDSVAQQLKVLSESQKLEVNKVVNAVNGIATSCEERLSRLEGFNSLNLIDLDRDSSANGSLQGFKQDFDQQMQKVDQILMQMRSDQRALLDKITTHREEVQLDQQVLHQKVDACSRELRAQVDTAIQGLAQELRSDLLPCGEADQGLSIANEATAERLQQLEERVQAMNTVLMEYDVPDLQGAVRGQAAVASSQQDLLILQEDQRKIDQAVVDLKRQTQQSLEDVRNEFANEVMMMRQMQVGSLLERVQSLEASAAEMQELQDLSRQCEDISTCLESDRNSNLQTTTELSSRIDWVSDKVARLESRRE